MSRSITISILVAVFAGGCGSSARVSEWLPCTFVPIEVGARDVVAQCARRSGEGTLVIGPAALSVLAERGLDPAPVLLGHELHYLNAAGVAVPVLPFDNGADYFVEGFARTTEDGKVGFINESLRVVIRPSWDFAFPFESGRAVVCNGCSFRPVGDGHREVVGGRWGIIDTRGEVVVPVTYQREALPAQF